MSTETRKHSSSSTLVQQDGRQHATNDQQILHIELRTSCATVQSTEGISKSQIQSIPANNKETIDSSACNCDYRIYLGRGSVRESACQNKHEDSGPIEHANEDERSVNKLTLRQFSEKTQENLPDEVYR